jgi:hypothetical protein
VEREITLAGLPGGVIVSTYKNNHITKAGEHTVTALLSFDRENYDGPSELSYKLTVARRVVPIPSLAPAMYSGALLSPSVPESSLYSLVDPPRVLHAGRYPVTLHLSDGVNDCFEGSETSETTLFFEVLPMAIRVSIEGVSLYLGEEMYLPEYRVIAGNPLAGDDLGFGVREVRGGYEYYFENPDYAVTFEGGIVKRIYRLPPAAESALFLGGAALLFIVLSVFGLILLYKKRVRPMAGEGSMARGSACTYPLFTKDAPRALSPSEDAYRIEQKDPPPVYERAADALPDEKSEPDAQVSEEGGSCVDAVDVATADALITDALAEALVMAEERVIYTEGSRHGVINVDTLSAAFAAGEEVDINRLKKKKLIAQDVGYLKVLARGSINKPLTVYADDFSLGAIKMIALTGGRTFHVKTKRLP